MSKTKDRMDGVGRIVIPKWVREECGLVAGSKLEFVPKPKQNGVLVKKGKGDYCVSCGALEDLIQSREGVFLCRDCVQKLFSKL